ncbi:MAG: right-handed parallel beta-helix repeat-containing protein, partial [Dehalococcoidia bacterium]|nr:right-handed parallel beta-helix repeat-containing protein [Dehalococcoidia bacterium]
PSQDNKIIGNEIYDSWGGLYVGAWGSASMIRTDNSGTVIQGNYFHDLTDFAVGFGFTDSTNVDISGNTMENNPYGICVYGWWVEGGLADLTDTTVTGNTIDSNPYGILIVTGNQWTMEDNEITNNGYGIYVMQSTGIEAHHNNIVGNIDYGINNGGPNVVDATNNYWDSPTGPSRELPNGKWVGKGDKVSSNVDYTPWLPQPIEFWHHRAK